MKTKEKISEPNRQYLINFFQVFSFMCLLFIFLSLVLDYDSERPNYGTTSSDYLVAYFFISGFCILYTCHSVAREFYRSEKFEEYFKLKGLSRDEYIKSRDLLNYIEK